MSRARKLSSSGMLLLALLATGAGCVERNPAFRLAAADGSGVDRWPGDVGGTGGPPPADAGDPPGDIGDLPPDAGDPPPDGPPGGPLVDAGADHSLPAPIDLTTGLLGHWPLDEGPAGLTSDISGNGN